MTFVCSADFSQASPQEVPKGRKGNLLNGGGVGVQWPPPPPEPPLSPPWIDHQPMEMLHFNVFLQRIPSPYTARPACIGLMQRKGLINWVLGHREGPPPGYTLQTKKHSPPPAIKIFVLLTLWKDSGLNFLLENKHTPGRDWKLCRERYRLATHR